MAQLSEEELDKTISFDDNCHPDSDIVQFYNDSTIFLTGGTGFLGNQCLEKLLRTCSNLRKLYILMRPKKGKDLNQRCQELFSKPNFDPLKKTFPNFIDKIELIPGDISLPDLGLNDEDERKLINEVNCIFHFAANVRFREHLRKSAYLNVRSVRDILKLAQKAPHLKAFVHVSTAYSNCIHKIIEEKIYKPPMIAGELLNLVELLNDSALERVVPILLEDFPNTYTFTKCIAEDLVRTEGKGLPVAIVRPSIVVAAAKEPLEGWVDSISGASGGVLGTCLGLIRCMRMDTCARSDIVPVDYTVNTCLAVAWDIYTTKELKERKVDDGDQIPVYNFVNGPEKPLLWGEFVRLAQVSGRKVPSEKCLWYGFLYSIVNPYKYTIMVFLMHTIPAYIVDLVLFCRGDKPILIKAYQKIDNFCDDLVPFMTNSWTFSNRNTQALWKKLKPKDKDLFEFNMTSIDWEKYFGIYLKGVRTFLIKDPMETVEEGKVKYRILIIKHFSLCAVLSSLVIFLFYKLLVFCLNLL